MLTQRKDAMSTPTKLRSIAPLPDHVNGVSALDGGALDGTVRRRRKGPGQSILVDIDKLENHPDNTRKKIGNVDELARTMEEVGQLQDLVVCPHPDKGGGRYYVIVGNRRLKAGMQLEWAQMRCFVRPTVLGVRATLKAMLIENWEHKDIEPMDKAEALGRLYHEEGMKLSEIARSLGKHEATISGYLALLDLSDDSREKVRSGELSVAMATRAVRAARARADKKKGHADKRQAISLSWEPDHFTSSHYLAPRAKFFCNGLGHNNRRLIGNVACGHCWQQAIEEHTEKIILLRFGIEPGTLPENIVILSREEHQRIASLTAGNVVPLPEA